MRDRIVQGALRHVLEPIFEAEFAEHSYGFRPGRGAKDGLWRVDTLLKADHDWVVDTDLKSYFDMIAHDRLLALVKARVAGGRRSSQRLQAAPGYVPRRHFERYRRWLRA
ncbi:MAG: reverse transcriptase domain-containing protein [Verrucomicrobiota bacterium]